MVTRQHEAPLYFARSKEKQRSVRGDFSESLTLRVHRAISCLGRSEKETDDTDVPIHSPLDRVQLGIWFGCKFCEQ